MEILPSTPIVCFSTLMGCFRIKVLSHKAPISSAAFLRLVKSGAFADGGGIFRVVRSSDNDIVTPPISVVQGGLLTAMSHLIEPPVPHEPTNATGLSHRTGTVSLARGAVGTATGESFFVTLEESCELDFGGTRHPDGQGFAAFGEVIDGLNVLAALQRLKTLSSDRTSLDSQLLEEPVQFTSVEFE